ncbi:MAG: hypothetical protein WKF97_04760 [Chitinophagaceae bacterium]
MKKYTFALTGISLSVMVITLLASRRPLTATSHHHHADPIATHNMLVVGEKAVYLSHLPMFQQKGKPPMPHRYQVILEVGLEKQGSSPQNDYMKDRQSHPSTKIYTINPENFLLPTLITPGLNGDPLSRFNGTIFRGHFERGGTSILQEIDVRIRRVVYFKSFDSIFKKSTQLEYLLFGKGQELFLAHLITAPPDFDQVLSVNITGHKFSDEALAKGIRMVLPNTVNSPSTRIKEKQQVKGIINADSSSTPRQVNVSVIREFYFEETELRVPPDFGTSPEEKKSGFL